MTAELADRLAREAQARREALERYERRRGWRRYVRGFARLPGALIALVRR